MAVDSSANWNLIYVASAKADHVSFAVFIANASQQRWDRGNEILIKISSLHSICRSQVTGASRREVNGAA